MGNFDPYATIDDDSCVAKLFACLDQTALNYGCKTKDKTFANCFPVQGSKPYNEICNYYLSPPPAASWSFTAAGEVSDITDQDIDQIQTDVATLAGVTKQEVFVRLSSGSVNVVVEIRPKEPAKIGAIKQALQPVAVDDQTANAFFIET